MRSRWMEAILLASAMVFSGCAKKDKEAVVTPSPADQYVTNVLECLKHTEAILPDMKAAADSAASRWAKGGKVYVTDDETIDRTGKETVKKVGTGVTYPMSEDWGGFVAEACDRAGGGRHIQPVPVDFKVTKKDIVLASTVELNPGRQIDQLKKLRDNGALIILFGSKDAKAASAADFLVDNGLPAGIVPVMNASGDSTLIGPVAPMANVINLWTFTAELVGAMNHLGKMPAFYKSMFVPGADDWNKRIEKVEFEPSYKPQTVEPGALGIQFVQAARASLESMKTNELSKFESAGALCANTMKSGKKVVAGIIGHFMVAQTRMPGYPNLFTVEPNQYGREFLQGKLSAGDVFLHVGYSYIPADELAFAKEVGAKSIGVFTAGPTKPGEGEPVPPDTTAVDVYIDPYWKHGDAVVEVPGYDVKICPVSGVVMITSYWMIIGETAKAMAK